MLINVLNYGADSKGIEDSTAAIQKAMEDAAKTNGCVYIPGGKYLTGELQVPANIEIKGDESWSFRGFSGSVLEIKDENNRCLLDVSDAIGTTINGLVLNGAGLGKGIHGVMIDKDSFNKTENTVRIERCKIGNFSGDGVHFDKVWCFSMRSSFLHGNKGHGLYMYGWDGFMMDNWFTGNGKWGACFDKGSNAITLTANRVEWNKKGGLCFLSGGMVNAGNNYIDRSGGPGICVKPYADKEIAGCFTFTGNVIYRNGASLEPDGEYESCHVYFERVNNLCFTSNVLSIGRGDRMQGNWSPQYGIIVKDLKNSIIKDNAINNSCIKKCFLDLGEHGENCIFENNVGKEAGENPKSWLVWD
jgi:hypothetical protein